MRCVWPTRRLASDAVASAARDGRNLVRHRSAAGAGPTRISHCSCQTLAWRETLLNQFARDARRASRLEPRVQLVRLSELPEECREGRARKTMPPPRAGSSACRRRAIIGPLCRPEHAPETDPRPNDNDARPRTTSAPACLWLFGAKLGRPSETTARASAGRHEFCHSNELASGFPSAASLSRCGWHKSD